jgi:hypothetical protein
MSSGFSCVAKCLLMFAEGCVVEFTSHMQDMYKTVYINKNNLCSLELCPEQALLYI